MSGQSRADSALRWLTIFAGTYGIGVFRSSDSGRSWQTINNGLPALYPVRSHQSPMVTSSSEPILWTALGGVYRSTDNGDSWIRCNQGVIESDVRALAINSRRSHFCRNLRWGVSVACPLHRRRRKLDASEQRRELREHLVAGDQFGITSSREPPGVEMVFIVLLTMETVGRWLIQV